MALKSNIHYWQISLQNPEPYSDPHYIYSKVIIQDEEFTGVVSQLRELIVSYCVLKELEYEGRELAEDAIVRDKPYIDKPPISAIHRIRGFLEVLGYVLLYLQETKPSRAVDTIEEILRKLLSQSD